MAATKLLAAVLEQKASLDGLLDEDHGNPAFVALNPTDRAMVKAILHSCLRHLTWIESIFARFLDKPLPDGARNLRHILAIAAAQILFLDIPDHSAVDLAVEQARRDPRSARFANLVNALLRRLGREKDSVLAAVSQEVDLLPGWFMQRLVSAYGIEAAKAISIACATPAPIDLTVKSDPQGWAERLGGTVLATGTVRLGTFEGSVTALPGFTEGEWWVQDAAAAIPARLMGDIRGKKVADLCAAPGGKTAQLVLQGAQVTAVEQSASRLKRLQSNLGRLGLSCATHLSKLEDFEPDQPLDAILLDAPCSSTGTIRRHPDVLWSKGPEDIEKLAGVQRRLLEQAFRRLPTGGKLVFSNCSLDPIEGENLISVFLSEHAEAELVAIDPADWPGLETAVTGRGEMRTTPAMLGGMDGFYAAVIRRK
ncbi:16S rRNA (cytosine967-C5)-methyltransferase [Rhizobium alvei]|uniref:RsmB/NOP family class I SAM-dependent RNA methyltransferase n=2 Tax=Rhizobium alvei TaxID=1132659 RepID=A0ABT8YLZ5_9HYPH|nr:RsmB/NOP family class I SAM-dependent RNA methyltransferase [Rhizobium alvei]MDO6964745.1 RsmB/NOP family class I SAM-dependent RNA methyltransferase [Rhizobium alvei]